MSDPINPIRSASVPISSDKQPTYSPLVKTIAKLAYAILFPITLPITSAAESAYKGTRAITPTIVAAEVSAGTIGGFFDRIATKIMKVYAKVFDKQPLLKEIAYKEHMFNILDQYSKTLGSPDENELKPLMEVYQTFTNPTSSQTQKKDAATKFISAPCWKEVGAKNPLLIKELFGGEQLSLVSADLDFVKRFFEAGTSNPSALMKIFKLDDQVINEVVTQQTPLFGPLNTALKLTDEQKKAFLEGKKITLNANNMEQIKAFINFFKDSLQSTPSLSTFLESIVTLDLKRDEKEQLIDDLKLTPDQQSALQFNSTQRSAAGEYVREKITADEMFNQITTNRFCQSLFRVSAEDATKVAEKLLALSKDKRPNFGEKNELIYSSVDNLAVYIHRQQAPNVQLSYDDLLEQRTDDNGIYFTVKEPYTQLSVANNPEKVASFFKGYSINPNDLDRVANFFISSMPDIMVNDSLKQNITLDHVKTFLEGNKTSISYNDLFQNVDFDDLNINDFYLIANLFQISAATDVQKQALKDKIQEDPDNAGKEWINALFI